MIVTIKESLDFSYAGKYSIHMGLRNVSTKSGLYEETFNANKSIIEEKIPHRSKPYLFGVEYDPLTTPLTFMFDEKWTDKSIEDVALWLYQNKYQPLYFTNNINRIFYCMPVNDFSIIHNGLKQGYLELTFRCDTFHAYTPTYQETFDFTNNTIDGMDFTFTNKGHLPCQPRMQLTTVDGGEIKIINYSDSGKEFKFIGLANNETLFIDNENEHIETDLTQTYRFSNFNNQYLSLPRGVNRLKVYGKCKITFQTEFKILI